ncbi:Retinol dehydrogenase 7 [Fukomys damarensis]|uniref:Retinol dehydrogenase 7 n=1 Tax=Fukomys damarensis TaxID=885580 RepID=A0A091CXM9_FUKDA|nr:Retinol dehydrogenase 7 [Fukomys damarensis]
MSLREVLFLLFTSALSSGTQGNGLYDPLCLCGVDPEAALVSPSLLCYLHSHVAVPVSPPEPVPRRALVWERQVVSNPQDKYVLFTGCDSGFGNLLARQLDTRGLRVLAVCLTEKGAEQLRKQTSARLETVILDVTQTESIAAAAHWVKERLGDRIWPQESVYFDLCV